MLVAGELFEGGWQHRALNNDILLIPGQQLVASVSCVEHGRWHGATAQVRRSRRASMMVRSAQAVFDDEDRQNQVWNRVSRYDAAFGASPTASYVDHLNRRADPDVTGRRARVRSPSGTGGVAEHIALNTAGLNNAGPKTAGLNTARVDTAQVDRAAGLLSVWRAVTLWAPRTSSDRP